MIAAIVAVDNDYGIGFNGDLLERIPEDLKFFKKKTENSTIVMGRKTWDSLPKKPLPNRLNIIISNKPRTILDDLSICISMDEIKSRLSAATESENWFIIGGGSIYRELLPYCNEVYLTKIFKTHENIDTYFPNLDEMEEWCLENCSEIKTYKDINYQFKLYRRQ